MTRLPPTTGWETVLIPSCSPSDDYGWVMPMTAAAITATAPMSATVIWVRRSRFLSSLPYLDRYAALVKETS